MSLPYFPLYPSDFEAKTSHLTLEEDGAYNRLLRLSWMTPGCSLPDDPAWIARRMRVDMATFERVVAPLLDEFFYRTKGRVINGKLTEIYSETNDKHSRRVDAGKKGGRPPKPLKSNEVEQSNTKPMPKQPEPEPEPYKKKKDTSVSLAASAEIQDAVAAYNSAASQAGWPTVQRLTDQRKALLRGRLSDAGGIGGWRAAMARASASDFLCGRVNSRDGPFVASFDWMTKAANFTKLMEGNYDNRARNSSPENPAIRAIINAAGSF